MEIYLIGYAKITAILFYRFTIENEGARLLTTLGKVHHETLNQSYFQKRKS